MDTEKQALRDKMKSLRAACPGRPEKSRAIMERCQALIHSDDTVAFYASFGSEVDTEPLDTQLRRRGTKRLLPVIDGRALRFVELPSWCAMRDLGTRAYGIRTPPASWRVVAPADIDVFVVPGLAFDERGNRLGYGGGFYDRAFACAPAARKIGVAFSCSLIENVPVTSTDVAVDYVVSENHVLQASDA